MKNFQAVKKKLAKISLSTVQFSEF